MIKTVKVTGVAYKQDGTPASGASGSARLSIQEIDNGIVVPATYTICVGDDGHFEFDVWPNERGVEGSYYSVKIYLKSNTVFDAIIVVPDVEHEVSISDIINEKPYPPVDKPQQALLGAQKAATEAKASAEDAEISAVSASESAQASADSAASIVGAEERTNASADSAKGSEEAARLSETNAKSSEDAAKLSETKAKDSEDASAIRAQEAADSAASIVEAVTEAQEAANNAQASASSAATSASNASVSEQNAENSANLFAEQFAQMATAIIETQTIVVNHHGFGD